jgi:hypothetical protein
VIDPATWAGSVPQVNGIAPRVRVGRGWWFNLLWSPPIGSVLPLILVAVAKGLRGDPSTEATQISDRAPASSVVASGDTPAIPAPTPAAALFIERATRSTKASRSEMTLVGPEPRLGR